MRYQYTISYTGELSLEEWLEKKLAEYAKEKYGVEVVMVKKREYKTDRVSSAT